MQVYSTYGIGVQQGIKCGVYAKAGYGKTVLMSTAPNPVILSAESGLLSLSRFRIAYIPIRNVNDLTEAHRWALSSREARQFATIGIDSVSEIGEVVLANAKGQVKDARLAYTELVDKMSMTIRAFRDLQGYNVVMSAKQEFVKDDHTGVMKNMPSMPGKQLTRDFPYFFDELFQIDIGKLPDQTEYRFLRTQPDFSNEAKDRSGMLDPIEEPNLTKVFAKINRVAQPR